MRRSGAVAFAATMVFCSSSAWAVSDHLQCFKIKDDAAKAAYAATLTPTDPAFAAAAGCSIKVPAKLLCLDVAKSGVVPSPPGAPDGDPAQTYLCYKAKCDVEQPDAEATDQFGAHNLTKLKTSLLCAPVGTQAPAGCVSDIDCPGAITDCQNPVCQAGTCGTAFASAGTPTVSQTAGDCQAGVCDGAGGTTSQADDADVPADDGNACTSETCVAGAPSSTAAPAGTACNGSNVCNGSGACVECNGPSDCPGVDTECQSRSCTANTCGVAFAPAGTVVAGQTPGDCQQNVCDGTGSVEAVEDNGDVPDDGNQCTNDSCVFGTPQNSPVADSSPCNQNGGTSCVSGTCQ